MSACSGLKLRLQLSRQALESLFRPHGRVFRERVPMKSYNVAVIGGDGTGPEVVQEAIKVLDVASKKFELKLNYTHFDFGGDRYLRTKEVLPDSAVDDLRKFPVVLLGA